MLEQLAAAVRAALLDVLGPAAATLSRECTTYRHVVGAASTALPSTQPAGLYLAHLEGGDATRTCYVAADEAATLPGASGGAKTYAVPGGHWTVVQLARGVPTSTITSAGADVLVLVRLPGRASH